ncbi:MAG: hypothetical protein JWQ63_4004 [Mucilaginibacter sp.]|nr:hypothetical protein [Mucilaginibacter sp.]
MLREINNFFLQKEEPVKSCLLFLREFILNYDKNITEAWKYKMPFYFYKSKMFCYLWVNKKTNQPYVGIVEGRKVEHPLLIIEKRSRMKIMLLDPKEDIPVNTINSILKMALNIYNVI